MRLPPCFWPIALHFNPRSPSEFRKHSWAEHCCRARRMSEPDALTDFLPEPEEPDQPLRPPGPGARGFYGRRSFRPRRKAALPVAALLSSAHVALVRVMATARGDQRASVVVASFGGGILVGVLAMQFFGGREPVQPPATARMTAVPSPAAQPSPAARASLAAVPSSDAVPAAATTRTTTDESDAVPEVPRTAETRRAGGQGAATKYRGGLRIDSQPAGATVFMNNQQVGHTPVVLSSLQPGSRAIRVQLNGYAPWSRAIRVVANQQATVSAQLAPAQ